MLLQHEDSPEYDDRGIAEDSFAGLESACKGNIKFHNVNIA